MSEAAKTGGACGLVPRAFTAQDVADREALRHLVDAYGHCIDRRDHLGIVEAILGLALELKLAHRAGNVHRHHRNEPFAKILAAELHALGQQLMHLDIVAKRL